MVVKKKDLIAENIEEGTGAAIGIAVAASGLRSGLRIWFADLEEKSGPVAELKPHGLKGHRITLTFGSFSGPIIRQIATAKQEDIQLARALVSSIRDDVSIDIADQQKDSWAVRDGSFRITATIRLNEDLQEDDQVSETCKEVIVPLMAAMAELIGYDIIEQETDDETPAYDGAILQSVVKRRERNPRNRLLCIRIHGEKCFACGLEPLKSYNAAGSIIEVHHLEPLASLSAPKIYSPETDLVPLCPNCHRAIHTRRPVPYTIDELKGLMRGANG